MSTAMSQDSCRRCGKQRIDNSDDDRFYRCGACTLYPAHYCSGACQQEDWSLHREICQSRVAESAFYRFNEEGAGNCTERKVDTDPLSANIGIKIVTEEGDELPPLFDLESDAGKAFMEGYERRKRGARHYSEDRRADRDKARETLFANMQAQNRGNFFSNAQQLDSIVAGARTQLDAARALRDELSDEAERILNNELSDEDRVEGIGRMNNEQRQSFQLLVDKIRRTEVLKEQFSLAPNRPLERKIRELQSSTNAGIAGFAQQLGSMEQGAELPSYSSNEGGYEQFEKDATLAQLNMYAEMMRAKYVGIDETVRDNQALVSELTAQLDSSIERLTKSDNASRVETFLSEYSSQIQTALAGDPIHQEDALITERSLEVFPSRVAISESVLLSSDDEESSDSMSQKIGVNGGETGKTKKTILTTVDVADAIAARVREIIADMPFQESKTIVDSIVEALGNPNQEQLQESNPLVGQFVRTLRQLTEQYNAAVSQQQAAAGFTEFTFFEPPTAEVHADGLRQFLTLVSILQDERDLKTDIVDAIGSLSNRSFKYQRNLATVAFLGLLATTASLRGLDALASSRQSRTSVFSVESLTLTHQQLALTNDLQLPADQRIVLLDKAIRSMNEANANGGTFTTSLFGEDEALFVERLDGAVMKRIYELNDALLQGKDIEKEIKESTEAYAPTSPLWESIPLVVEQQRPLAIRHLELNRLLSKFLEAGTEFRTPRKILQLSRDLIEVALDPAANLFTDEQRQRIKDMSAIRDPLDVTDRVTNLVYQELQRIDALIGSYLSEHENFLDRGAAAGRCILVSAEIEKIQQLVEDAKKNLGLFLNIPEDQHSEQSSRLIVEQLAENLSRMAVALDDIADTRFYQLFPRGTAAGASQLLRLTSDTLVEFSASRTLDSEQLSLLEETFLSAGDDVETAPRTSEGLETEMVKELGGQTYVDSVRRFCVTLLNRMTRQLSVPRKDLREELQNLAQQTVEQVDRENAANQAILRVSNAIRTRDFRTMLARTKQQLSSSNAQSAQAQLAVTYLMSQLLPEVDAFVAAQLDDKERNGDMSEVLDSVDALTQRFETWTFNKLSGSLQSFYETELTFLDEWYVSGQFNILEEALDRIRATVEQNVDKRAELKVQEERGRLNEEEEEELRRFDQDAAQASRLEQLLALFRDYFKFMAIWNASIPQYLLLFSALMPRKLMSKVRAIGLWVASRNQQLSALRSFRALFDPLEQELEAAILESREVGIGTLKAQQLVVRLRKQTDAQERIFWQTDSVWLRLLSSAARGASFGVSDLLALLTVQPLINSSLLSLPIVDQFGSLAVTRSVWTLFAMKWMQRALSTASAFGFTRVLPVMAGRAARRATTMLPGVGSQRAQWVANSVENYFGFALWTTSASLATRYPDLSFLTTQEGLGSLVGWFSLIVTVLYSAVWTLGAEAERSIFRQATRRE